MASDRQKAVADLNAKLRLEAGFRRQWREVERQLSLAVMRSIGTTGGLPSVEVLTEELATPVLRRHYDDVAAVFDKRMRPEFAGTDLEMTDEEAAVVAGALALAFDRRAPEQAAIIGQTNAQDAQAAVAVAEMERRRLAAEGENLGQRDVAVTVGAIFDRRLQGRSGGIVALETQAPAEASKLTEAQVLSGVAAAGLAVLGGRGELVNAALPIVVPTKEWASQGDQRVRDHHLRADSIQVSQNEAFVVGGQRLNHPGDTSLGATAFNIVNCRCAAVYNVASVKSARQDLARIRRTF